MTENRYPTLSEKDKRAFKEEAKYEVPRKRAKDNPFKESTPLILQESLNRQPLFKTTPTYGTKTQDTTPASSVPKTPKPGPGTSNNQGATSGSDPFHIGEGEAEKMLAKRLNKVNEAYNELDDPERTNENRRQEMIDDLKKVRDNREKSLAWAQLAERFLAAATKFGAAKEGLGRGLDMSQAEIERTDWDALTNRAFDKYKEDYANLIGKFEGEDKLKAATDKQKAAIAKTRADLKLQLAKLKDARAKESRAARERQLDRAAKAAKSSEFEKKMAKGRAEEMLEWSSKDRANTLTKMNRLERAEDILNQLDDAQMTQLAADIAGPEWGATVGNLAQRFGFGPEFAQAAEVLRSVEQVTQTDIKRVLDSQYAAREADRVLQRDFPKGATPEIKKAALKERIQVLRDYYKEREHLHQYLIENQATDPAGLNYRSPFAEKYANVAKEESSEKEKPLSEADRKELEMYEALERERKK